MRDGCHVCAWPEYSFEHWRLVMPAIQEKYGLWRVWKYEGPVLRKGALHLCQKHLHQWIEKELLLTLTAGNSLPE